MVQVQIMQFQQQIKNLGKIIKTYFSGEKLTLKELTELIIKKGHKILTQKSEKELIFFKL